MVICAGQSGCLLSREQAFRRIAYIASFQPGDTVSVLPNKSHRPENLVGQYFASKPEPSQRTELLLRKYSVLERYREEPLQVILWLQRLAAERPNMEEVHALAELAEIEAVWLGSKGQTEEATNLYATAVTHSYQFLFAPQLDINRNAYDPQFRSICDIYNRSLAELLRQVCEQQALLPGQLVKIGDDEGGFEFSVEIAGRWKEQEFERFELVHDYQTTGLENQYHTYGLGVPLIAIRKQQAINSPVEKYYPPNLTLPMTAFCHFQSNQSNENDVSIAFDGQSGRRRGVLTLYDPLEKTSVVTDSQVVPLESDITTPLAYNLRDPIVNTGVLATASLLNAELAPELYGMFMLEPYDPNKIPVVMVHGLWSSPITWVHMFNDLRANADIHANYQFWFYSYPTGQPFWFSARQMRNDLATVRRELDPRGDSKSLDQMVLVGHSMGGLISTMQTMDSADRFWRMVSDQSIGEFAGDPNDLLLLRETFFFQPNPSVRRVVTIASPFEGSQFANQATTWISKKLFTLPEAELKSMKRIVKANGDKLTGELMLTTATSLDSLSAEAPVFKVMAESEVGRGVTFHNIYGRLPKRNLISLGRASEFQGDGVVSLESSAHPRAISQVAVPEEHSKLHQHSACIYEVRRILLENLVDLDRIRNLTLPELPVASALKSEPADVRAASSRILKFGSGFAEEEGSFQ
jgi:pimeloyl-ACP methyl ester carboxylesterase